MEPYIPQIIPFNLGQLFIIRIFVADLTLYLNYTPEKDPNRAHYAINIKVGKPNLKLKTK